MFEGKQGSCREDPVTECPLAQKENFLYFMRFEVKNTGFKNLAEKLSFILILSEEKKYSIQNAYIMTDNSKISCQITVLKGNCLILNLRGMEVQYNM